MAGSIMGNRSTAIAAIVAVLFMTACIGASSAQELAPGPSPSSAVDECLPKLGNMTDCLSYVMAGSNVTVPDKACCPELAGLVDSDPICLCQLLGKSDSYGIKIDLSRALKLPSVCRVSTPSVDLCSAAGIPIGAPAATQGQGSMSPGGSAASPPTGNNDNAASGNACSVLSVLVGLAFVFVI